MTWIVLATSNKGVKNAFIGPLPAIKYRNTGRLIRHDGTTTDSYNTVGTNGRAFLPQFYFVRAFGD